jgi:hypothetical protein
VNDLWALLAFITLVLLAPMLKLKFAGDDFHEQLETSFAKQVICVDGVELKAAACHVVHRWRGVTQWDRQGRLMNRDAQWLCRTPDGGYLLAIATATTPAKALAIRWAWRPLTEERAKQALVYNGKAYRAVCGASPC